MKQKMISVKSFLLALVFIVAATALLPTEAYSAGAKAEVELEVQAGFDGLARLGAYIPYRVLLINKGRAMEGEVQIEIKIDSENKTVFSKPFSLAEGASKEVVIEAPVFTARRGVMVKAVENGKTVKEIDYTFRKLIPPNMKTIGVLSSDNAAYGFLNGAMIPGAVASDYVEKVRLMQAAGVYYSSVATAQVDMESSVTKAEGVLIPLTGEDMPENLKLMKGFDILIISNFDTGSLSGEQLGVLEKWVEDGGTLVIGTGAGWKKAYEALPEALKKFSVTGALSEAPPAELSEFSGTSLPDNGINMDIVTGSLGFEYKEPENPETEEDEEGTASEAAEQEQMFYSANIDEVIMGNAELPLAVKYIHQGGRILFLAFDPGMEPIAGWEGKQSLWENLLFHSSNTNVFREQGTGYYYSNYNNSYYFNNLASQVPDDKKPPFLFMFITIGAYIVIAGPVMYIFLKKKDRRDLNWLMIPAVAVACLLVIYLAGFRTRYRTAVLNTASIIRLDMEKQKADITTGMGIFNNKRGDLKLTYSRNDNIDFDITQTNSRSYNVYADGTEPEGRLVSRLVLTEPESYELYDVSMWEPRYLTAKKSEPFNGKLIDSVLIKDGKIAAVIKNTTQYDFMDAFLTIGSNFISVGDILSGEEKAIEADLNSEDVYKSFEAYLDAKYGRSSYPSSMTPPDDFPEKRRKRTTAESILGEQYYSIREKTKIGLYALNSQDLDYNLQINGERPATYYTNGIFSSMDIPFEKGSELDIPSGIVLPLLDNNAAADVDGDNGIVIRRLGDLDFTYEIPKDIRLSEFSLKFDTYLPFYVKYNFEEMKRNNENMQMSVLQNQYEYYLYNQAKDAWEKIEDAHTQSQAGSYVDEYNRLRVRVRVLKLAASESRSDNSYYVEERLALPGLSLKGVVR